MQTEIKLSEGKIQIVGPYSESNNETWRSLGGKFSSGSWEIPDNETSRKTVAELFGAKSDEIEVLVPASLTKGSKIAQIGGYVLAQRRYRDSAVQMPDGVSLAAGSFSSSGGSTKRPSVSLSRDVVFRLTCRKSFAEVMGLEVAKNSSPEIEI